MNKALFVIHHGDMPNITPFHYCQPVSLGFWANLLLILLLTIINFYFSKLFISNIIQMCHMFKGSSLIMVPANYSEKSCNKCSTLAYTTGTTSKHQRIM